jgi:hypothetical protein
MTPGDGSHEAGGQPIDLESLQRRVTELEAHAAITDVLYQYAHSIDYGDEEAFLDCFTEDAVRESVNVMTGGVQRQVGREQLAAFISGHTRPPLYHKHLMLVPRIQIDGDTASSVCYFTIIVGFPGGVPETIAIGRCIDTLKCRDGRWRISMRGVEVEAMNPMWSLLRDARRNELGLPPQDFLKE